MDETRIQYMTLESDEHRIRLPCPEIDWIQGLHGADRLPSRLEAPIPQKEVVVLGKCSYDGPEPDADDATNCLIAQMSLDLGPGNFWILPSASRMPYPYGLLFLVQWMMNAEKQTGRRADWFLYLDDDFSVPNNAARILREAADPKDRPFIAALPYDRSPPFHPAVYSVDPADGEMKRWLEPPQRGTHPVSFVGLCCGLFHRRLFDPGVIEQPWFMAMPALMEEGKNRGTKPINPDSWWCERLKQAGITPYCCCDFDGNHASNRVPINRRTAPILRKMLLQYGGRYAEIPVTSAEPVATEENGLGGK